MSISIPAGLFVRKSAASPAGNLSFAISAILYCSVSEYFRPYYEFAYAQMLIAYAFIFMQSLRTFLFAMVVGGVAVCAVAEYPFDYLQPLMAHPAYSTSPLTAGAFAGISLLVYLSFSRQRLWREAAQNRFGLLGQHASTLVHDLKGQLTVPMLQVE